MNGILWLGRNTTVHLLSQTLREGGSKICSYVSVEEVKRLARVWWMLDYNTWDAGSISVEDTTLQLLYSSSAPPTIEMSPKEPGRVVRITADSHWCVISRRIRCLNKGEALKKVIKWLLNLHQISSCLYLQCDNPLTTFLIENITIIWKTRGTFFTYSRILNISEVVSLHNKHPMKLVSLK